MTDRIMQRAHRAASFLAPFITAFVVVAHGKRWL